MTIDGALLDSLTWRCIGPFRGGRSVAVTGHPTDLMTFYFGACAGGVWKTVDGGTYWENVSDGFFQTAAVGAIDVAPSDGHVVYAGTGEACIRGNVSHGDGVYRSTDGGATWTNIGLRNSRHIGRVRVHPHDPDVVYVAALGHAWGPSRERGVFRSRDGGASWQHALFKSEDAGAVDLSLDPTPACGSPPTAATRGPTSRTTRDCRAACWAASASRCRPPTAGACTRWWKPTTARCSGRTTRGPRGSA
jgi:hypothetical protein